MEMSMDAIMIMLEELSESISRLQMIITPLTSIGSLATYILLGLSVMMLSQSLGLKNPWLSWIPYANVFAFGRLADQYIPEDPAKRDKPRRSAKLLLILSIALVVVAFIMAIFAVVVIVLAIAEVPTVWILFATIAMLIAVLALLALSVVYSVFYYIAFYKITKLFMGKQYQLYFVLGLVLSLVGVSIALPVVMTVIAVKNQNSAKAAQNVFSGEDKTI